MNCIASGEGYSASRLTLAGSLPLAIAYKAFISSLRAACGFHQCIQDAQTPNDTMRKIAKTASSGRFDFRSILFLLSLDWRSLAMMRRYMAANRGRFEESVRRARVECLYFKRAGEGLARRRREPTTISSPANSSNYLYYDVSTGRFWSMDSYEGDLQSPVALHDPRVE